MTVAVTWFSCSMLNLQFFIVKSIIRQSHVSKNNILHKVRKLNLPQCLVFSYQYLNFLRYYKVVCILFNTPKSFLNSPSSSSKKQLQFTYRFAIYQSLNITKLFLRKYPILFTFSESQSTQIFRIPVIH